MALVGIALGVLAFFIVGPLLVYGVMTHNAQAAFIPGFVAGIWAAWPFFHKHGVQRYNFLHPVPKRYRSNCQVTFDWIVKILRETSYNYGDEWRIKSTEPASNRIVAKLNYTEKELDLEAVASGVQHRTKPVKRHIGLEVRMRPQSGSTIVQFDFTVEAEGLNPNACDGIISSLMNDVEAALGPGTEASRPLGDGLPAPPWWLLGITVFTLLALFSDVINALFGVYNP